LSVEEWRHRGTMARDNYVRVVYAGFLFPFGHRASLIKVTERKFHPSQPGNIAYLRQRMFIVVREPERIVGNSGLAYSGNDSDKSGELYDLQMPFKLVRLTTLVTPNLDPPEDSEILPGKKQSAFWPLVLKKDFQWHVVAEDLEGQVCEFAMPLVFVGKEINDFASNAASDPKQKQLSTLATNYEKSQNKERRTATLQGQLVSLAESDKAGDTTFETDSLIFGAEVPAQSVAKNLSAQNPRFFAMVRKAKLLLPALKNLVGNNQAAEFEFHHHYLVHGFANNAGKVFAKLSPDGFQTFPLSFPSDKSGGIATPNMNIQGLSRSFGPVGGTAQGVADLANGGFDPKDFFQGMSAKILGAIDLGEIITGSFLGGKNVPKLTTTPIYPGNDRTKPPTAIDTLLKWNPEVKAFGPFKPHNSNLDVEANLHTDLASGASTFTIDGELTDFDMDLFGFIILKFARVDFSAGSSKKLDVVPDIKEVVFGGPLEFVNELKDLLKFGGSGLALDVTPTGVRAGLVIAIPTISVGVLTIQNISFSAALNLPFTGEPVRFRFAFCERQDPFILTVYCFGGGGFFAIELGLDGMERLEAALEFGASAALDIGVASGSVEVMAGIYYKWEVEVALLEGYVRMGGSLNVLGIITLSLEFNLSLAYETGPNGGKVWGEASLTVEIEILFFSASVSMTVRREFADPDRVTFAKLMDSSEWNDYCDAFAV
jgi:hypothetical protein